MALLFEWDPKKARRNLAMHGVSFDEASTVLQDPLSKTIDDPLHAEDEARLVLLGHSHRNRLLVVVSTERGDRLRLISVRLAANKKGLRMKRVKNDPDMLDEYDFSGDVRGKYAKRYAENTNVVVIDPDVAEYFPDHDAVNEALRGLAAIIKRQWKAEPAVTRGRSAPRHRAAQRAPHRHHLRRGDGQDRRAGGGMTAERGLDLQSINVLL